MSIVIIKDQVTGAAYDAKSGMLQLNACDYVDDPSDDQLPAALAGSDKSLSALTKEDDGSSEVTLASGKALTLIEVMEAIELFVPAAKQKYEDLIASMQPSE